MNEKELTFKINYKEFNCSKENFKCEVVNDHFTAGKHNFDIVQGSLKQSMYHSKVGDFHDRLLVNCENIVTDMNIFEEWCDITVRFLDRRNIYDLIDKHGVDAFKVRPMFTDEYPLQMHLSFTRITDYHTFWFNGLCIEFSEPQSSVLAQ